MTEESYVLAPRLLMAIFILCAVSGYVPRLFYFDPGQGQPLFYFNLQGFHKSLFRRKPGRVMFKLHALRAAVTLLRRAENPVEEPLSLTADDFLDPRDIHKIDTLQDLHADPLT